MFLVFGILGRGGTNLIIYELLNVEKKQLIIRIQSLLHDQLLNQLLHKIIIAIIA